MLVEWYLEVYKAPNEDDDRGEPIAYYEMKDGVSQNDAIDKAIELLQVTPDADMVEIHPDNPRDENGFTIYSPNEWHLFYQQYFTTIDQSDIALRKQ